MNDNTRNTPLMNNEPCDECGAYHIGPCWEDRICAGCDIGRHCHGKRCGGCGCAHEPEDLS